MSSPAPLTLKLALKMEIAKPSLPPTPPDDKDYVSPHHPYGLEAPSPGHLDWEVTSRRKQEEREARLQDWPRARATSLVDPSVLDVCSIREKVLSQREVHLTNQTATQLATLIKKRQATAVEVLTAFIKAAVVAQDTTNCLTEIFFEDGLKRAAELDAHQQETGGVVGPLHGVPVSVKDHINIEGIDGASGFVGWAYHRVADKDAVVVQCMRKAGAVIYCKTANPQSLLAIETNNNIYGRTLNPHNRNLSAGGSSGGEGALIAMRGSPLGIGTDIAGSIRVPALWNGIYGLKPSVGRLPHTGLQGPHDGMDAIMGAVGPMALSLADLELFCSAVLSPTMAPWHLEHQTLYMPWSRPCLPADLPMASGRRKLTIAVMRDDDMVLPHPPVLAALDRAVHRLRDAGHEVIEWKPLRTQDGHDTLFTLLLQDRGQEYIEHLALSGEPAVPLIDWLLRERAPAQALREPKDLWALARRREALRQDGVDQWTALGGISGRPVDAVLCPGAPTLAPRHDKSRHWMYTAIWNVLDCPGITFPVAPLGPDAVHNVGNWPPHAPRSELEKEVWDEWNEAWYVGAPVGLQLIGRRLQEEKLLMDMEIVEAVLKASPA